MQVAVAEIEELEVVVVVVIVGVKTGVPEPHVYPTTHCGMIMAAAPLAMAVGVCGVVKDL